MMDQVTFVVFGFFILVYSQRLLTGLISREDFSRYFDTLQSLLQTRVTCFAVGALLGVLTQTPIVPILLVMSTADKSLVSLSQGFAVVLGAVASAHLFPFSQPVALQVLSILIVAVACVGIIVGSRRRRSLFDCAFFIGLILFGAWLVINFSFYGVEEIPEVRVLQFSIEGPFWKRWLMLPSTVFVGMVSLSPEHILQLASSSVSSNSCTLEAAVFFVFSAYLGLAFLPCLLSFLLQGSNSRRLSFGLVIILFSGSVLGNLFMKSLLAVSGLYLSFLGESPTSAQTLRAAALIFSLLLSSLWLCFYSLLPSLTRALGRETSERQIVAPYELIQSLPQYSQEFLNEFLYHLEKTTRLAKELFDALLYGEPNDTSGALELRPRLSREVAILIQTARRLRKLGEENHHLEQLASAVLPVVVRLDLCSRELEAVENMLRASASRPSHAQKRLNKLNQVWESLYSEVLTTIECSNEVPIERHSLATLYFQEVARGLQTTTRTLHKHREKGKLKEASATEKSSSSDM